MSPDAYPLDDPRVVAVLRLPLAVGALGTLTAGLERAYGPGLVLRQPATAYLTVELPEAPRG